MKDEVFISKAVDVVRQSIDDTDFGKEKFSEQMNMCPSLLYKKLKKITGHSPTDFIKLIRIECAARLLKTGDYTVTEVSEKVGFSNVSYFSIVFKKIHGVSPSKAIEKQSININIVSTLRHYEFVGYYNSYVCIS